MFKMIERHYKDGRYTADQVKLFVKANYITPDEYKEITGKTYKA